MIKLNDNTPKAKSIRQYLVEMHEIMSHNHDAEWFERADLTEYQKFLEERIAKIDAQSEAARKRRQERAQAEDELLPVVQAQLGEELKIVDDIVAALQEDYPEISSGQVTNRLSKLVKAGVAGKIAVNVGKGRRKMAYALAEFMPTDEE